MRRARSTEGFGGTSLTPDHMVLSSIELDAEAGRFPEVLAQYFRDDAWTYEQSYFVAPIKRAGREREYSTGRLTFEAALGQTVRVLAQNGGFRWGSALRVLNFLRVNLFLYDLTDRPDWQSMMMRFRASGSEDPRLFVNLDYLRGTPFKIVVAPVFGAVFGGVGGTLAWMMRARADAAVAVE